MIRVTLNTTTGDKHTIQVKTGWHDVTTAEYLAMQGKSEAELLQWLTGLTTEQITALDQSAAIYFAELLTAFTALPEVQSPVDVEGETVGKFETVKSFLRRYYREEPKTARARVLPQVYAIYLDKPVKEVQELPAEEVVPVALAILEQIEAVSMKYDKLARDAEEGGNDEAGEDDLAPFGFLTILHMLSGGDLLKHETIMQLSVRKVYTQLYFLKVLANSQKQEANG